MLFATVVLIVVLTWHGVDSQAPPPRGGGYGGPGGGYGRPGGAGGPSGKGDGRGPGGGSDAEKYLSQGARVCLRSCDAKDLICAVLAPRRMTDMCRTCLRTQCPRTIGTPGFLSERCQISAYVKCATSKACPVYTRNDQNYLSRCLQCRDNCVSAAMKAEITKKMKEAANCIDDCRTMYGCPAPPPHSCVECTRKYCGDGRQLTCVQNAFAGQCPTCRLAPSPTPDVVRKCQDCMITCEKGDNRSTRKPGSRPSGGYLSSGPASGGNKQRSSPDSRRDKQGGKGKGQNRQKDGPRGRLFADLVRHLPKDVVICLAKCPATCSDDDRVKKLLEKLSETCRNCMESTCPRTSGTPHFDNVDCIYRAHTTCGTMKGCALFTASEIYNQNTCTSCRDGCISAVLKNDIRNKMAKVASCQAQCVTTSECPPVPNGSCRTCIQRECVDMDDDDCRKTAITSGKCASCPTQEVRRNTKCLACMRKCRPEDVKDQHDGRPQQGRRENHFKSQKDRQYLPADSATCIDTKCGKCSSDDKIRNFMEGRPQKCRTCTNVMCPAKDDVPMFDHGKCQYEAHSTCGMYFGCEAISAEIALTRATCMQCFDGCIPEYVKMQVRSNMKSMSMCKSNCRATACGDKDMCDKCVDSLCANSFYDNCKELVSTSNCPSCIKNPNTKMQCDKCMDSCKPAMSTSSGYKQMQMVNGGQMGSGPHAHGSSGTHEHPSTGSHAHAGSGTHEHPSTGSHAHAGSGTHEHPSTGSHAHAGSGTHEHHSSSGYLSPTHEHQGSGTNDHMSSDPMTCKKACEAKGCTMYTGSCQECIKSVCDTSLLGDCENLVRQHGICPSCDSQSAPCNDCFNKCDAMTGGSS